MEITLSMWILLLKGQNEAGQEITLSASKELGGDGIELSTHAVDATWL